MFPDSRECNWSVLQVPERSTSPAYRRCGWWRGGGGRRRFASSFIRSITAPPSAPSSGRRLRLLSAQSCAGCSLLYAFTRCRRDAVDALKDLERDVVTLFGKSALLIWSQSARRCSLEESDRRNTGRFEEQI